MKILYLTHQYFPRHVGGTEIYTRGLVRRAVAAGHEVAVLSYVESPSNDPRDHGPRHTEHEGVPLVEIHANLAISPKIARHEYRNPELGAWVRAELERFAPDLVHAMHVMKLSGSALEACTAYGVPVIVTLCDFWFLCPNHTLLRWDGRPCNGPRHRATCVKCTHHTYGVANWPLVTRRPEWQMRLAVRLGLALGRREPREQWKEARWIAGRRGALRAALSGADRILALSRFQKEMFARNGFRRVPIEVLDHGLELEGLEPAPARRHETPVLGFIGPLREHKGVHVLLEALARRPDAKLAVHVHGAGSEGDPYAARVRATAARDPRVRLLGTFDPADLGRVLGAMDVLAMPALWYENNPLVLKAALRVGVPVLASRIGCLPEWIEPGRNGWLAPPGDVARWAEALDRALVEAAALRSKGQEIKSMDVHAREIFARYDELVAARA